MKFIVGIFGLLVGVAVVMVVVMYKMVNGSYLKIYIFMFDKMKGMKLFIIFFIFDVYCCLIDEKFFWEVLVYKLDVVLFGGDLVEGGVLYVRIEENIKCLIVFVFVIYVWGNNDYEVSQ